MLKEALEFQYELGSKSVEASLLDLPDHRVLLVKPGGVCETLEKGRVIRRDEVSALASLILWCESNADAANQLDIWVAEKSVEVAGNFESAVDCNFASLPLAGSRAWLTLAEQRGKGVRQKDFVRLLRGPLADSFDSQYLRVFQSMDFQRKNDGGRTLSHKGESLGRSIESAAQGRDGEIPERITFRIPRFDFSGSPIVLITVAIEIDAEAETIMLLAVGDTFTQATKLALSDIREQLAKAIPGASVYLA